MHVLQLGPYPPPEGGITRNVLAIRDELRRRGQRCSIIATSKSTHAEAEDGLYRPRSPLELIKLLRRIDFDVLHLHIGGDLTPRILGLMAACAALSRGRGVLTLHSGGYALEHSGDKRIPLFDRAVFRRFDRVIGVNPAMLEMFGRFGVSPERSRLIFPFVLRNPDPEVTLSDELTEFAAKHDPFLLGVCLLEDTYDLFMQIDALGDVLNKAPDAGLMIVGSGALESELRKAIGAKRYAERILLTGDVPHPQVLHLIQKASVLLRTTKFDGDAIAVREALFMGTPVIATDNGMRPEGVELIGIGDRDALSKAIIEVASNARPERAPLPDDTGNIDAVIAIYEEIVAENPT